MEEGCEREAPLTRAVDLRPCFPTLPHSCRKGTRNACRRRTVKTWVIHQALEKPNSNEATANVFMPVLFASQGRLGVIDVHPCHIRGRL